MMVEAYLWVKAMHIISVMAWMAGMLYLPRLFVYHCDAPVGSARTGMLEIMERRLLRLIINPAMVAAFVFGGWLLLMPGIIDWSEGWIHVKLVFVMGMTAVHGLLSRWRKDFAAGRNRHSAKFYRMMNEVPTLLMIAIVILVVVQPF